MTNRKSRGQSRDMLLQIEMSYLLGEGLLPAQVIERVRQYYKDAVQSLQRMLLVKEMLVNRNKATALERLVLPLLPEPELRLDTRVLLSELRLRFERSIGEWLSVHVEHSGGGDRKSAAREETTQRDLPPEIKKGESSLWQRVAAVPEHVFKAYILNAKQEKKPPTTTGLLRFAGCLPASLQRSRSDFTRWHCGCESMTVFTARPLHARCKMCGEDFVQHQD